MGFAVERHQQRVDRQLVIRHARRGGRRVVFFRREQAIGRDQAKRNQRHEQPSERKRDRPYGLDRGKRYRSYDRERGGDNRQALPQRRPCPRAHAGMARGKAFDRVQREGRTEMMTDRASHRVGRRQREGIRRQPRQHLAQSIGPEPVGREHEATGARALLEHASRQALPRACRRRRRDIGRDQSVLERRRASFSQRAVIVLRVEPAIGDHDLVRVHAPMPGNGAGARQGGLVDKPPDQKAVFRLQGTALARGKTRKLPLGSELRHKRHGNAPGIYP